MPTTPEGWYYDDQYDDTRGTDIHAEFTQHLYHHTISLKPSLELIYDLIKFGNTDPSTLVNRDSVKTAAENCEQENEGILTLLTISKDFLNRIIRATAWEEAIKDTKEETNVDLKTGISTDDYGNDTKVSYVNPDDYINKDLNWINKRLGNLL